MPRLWTNTIETHRREVHTAILESTAALVGQHGILSVTMSQIAEETGIGRATLYKYFPDVEAILEAWHQLHIDQHLAELERARDQAKGTRDRVTRVLERYALVQHDRRAHHATELAAHLHRRQHVGEAERELQSLIRGVLADAAAEGIVRTDVGVDELAHFCVRALAAGADLPSRASVQRLVRVVVDGLGVDVSGGKRHR